MGYFQGLSESYFKKSHDGRDIFYPWGVLGSGYVIPTVEKTKDMKSFFKKMGILSFLFVYFTAYISSAFGLVIGAGFTCLYLFFYYVVIQTLVRNLAKVDERLTLKESYINQANGYSYRDLILMSIGSFSFVVLGIWALVEGKRSGIGVLSILFFGLCFVVFVYQLLKKRKGS